MKKKLLALLLAGTMVFSNASLVFAAEEDPIASAEEAEATYNFVTPADAVKAAADGSAYILDVRLFENYTAGRITNSLWCPQFPLDDESLDAKLADYAKATFMGEGDTKPIYIVCNSGQRGAQRATANLLAAGIDEARIFTITGGAAALKEIEGALTTERHNDAIDWKYVEPADAIAAVDNDEIQIIDVRSEADFAKGHLKGALNCSLGTPADAALQNAFAAWVPENLDADQPIYITCYSGNRCAKTAISILKDLGYDTDKAYIIRGGASDATLSGAFVTDEPEYQFVTPEAALTASKEDTAYILDVRLFENYTAGRIANSLWCPQFPLDDESLDAGLVDYAKATFMGEGDTKPIYIVCNSGQRGAQRATRNLLAAGIAEDRIFTITGGAAALEKIEGALTTNRYDEKIDWKYVEAQKAVDDLDSEDYIQYIDVRDADSYTEGHLPGAINCNLKDVENADLQIAFAEWASSNLDADSPIYITCFSGNRCAKTAISILKDLGFDTNNIFIITGGAGNKTVSDAFVSLPFTDVYGADWYYNYVEFTYFTELMTGKDKNTFAPTEDLARAQFALILYRMEGSPKVNTTEPTFPDAGEDWYKDAVIWANQNKIITGYTNTGLFGPSDPITREQMATIMYRYANYKKWDVTASDDLSTFPDASSVTAFAKDAMEWVVANEIITGNNGKLDPQGSAVRAQASTIITRFVTTYPVFE
ncbi:rhodanese-like domain-containing protein [Dorea acetigenes]|uniref:Rhodanese-like domain-containing protein n=1 Tax=Dorea acetigenes TaxID=2981787 RepID=A0ABT2RHZ9_9FIRM|nr:rhodanese-like domain-containing protein [Dorea acetigenes]MCU6685027.1 rhodanese-like domain-containing protein [Dorea acetigenes]SCI34644.1 Endoglucanase precursor [uncultured Clostridium sp.]